MHAEAKTNVTLRRAVRMDAPALLRLIIALADFEKLTPPDAEAQKRLVEEGFGERPRFECWLAFAEGEPEAAGYAFFFETYSSFLARPTLYLEDIFVLPSHRGRGLGSALLRLCVRLARERGCGRMEWSCLDWNRRAQCVYEGMGARHLKEWYYYRMTVEDMDVFLRRPEQQTS